MIPSDTATTDTATAPPTMLRRSHLFLLGMNAVLWAGTVYVVIKPLWQPRERRGDYLWGHYALKEIYVGLPLLCVTLFATLLLLCPRKKRRKVGMRVGGLLFPILLAVFLFDLVYTFGLVGAWRADYWLDQAAVSRVDNVPDPDLGFVRKPHTSWKGRLPGSDRVVEYRTDSLGFRNPEDIAEADIVFLGDSYTEAAQVDVEETFPQIVARESKLRVVNLGRGAYGAPRELIVLQRHGLEREPKYVVWQLFEGNDLNDAQNYWRWKNQPGRSGMGLFQRYTNNSFFNGFLTRTLRNKRGEFARLRVDEGTAIPMSVRYRWDPERVGACPQGWELTRKALRDGVELCRSNGIQLCVLFIPVMARVHAERLTFDDPKDRARYLPADLGEQRGFATDLVAYCAQIGCPVLDAYSRFRAAADSDPAGIYIPSDEHLQPRGHRILADLVLEWLRSR